MPDEAGRANDFMIPSTQSQQRRVQSTQPSPDAASCRKVSRMDEQPVSLEALLHSDEANKPKKRAPRRMRWWLVGCAAIPLLACALCCFGVVLIGRAASGMADEITARYQPMLTDADTACDRAVSMFASGDIARTPAPLGRTVIFTRQGRTGDWTLDAWLIFLFGLNFDGYIATDPIAATSFTCIERLPNNAAAVYVMDRVTNRLIANRDFAPSADTVLWDNVDDWLGTL